MGSIGGGRLGEFTGKKIKSMTGQYVNIVEQLG
jgi:hypothetical protein